MGDVVGGDGGVAALAVDFKDVVGFFGHDLEVSS